MTLMRFARLRVLQFELFNLVQDSRKTTNLMELEPERFERMKEQLIEYYKEVLNEGIEKKEYEK